MTQTTARRPAEAPRLSVPPDSVPITRAPLASTPARARTVGIEVAVALHLVVLASLLALHTPPASRPPDQAIQMVFEPAPRASLRPPPRMSTIPDAPDAVFAPTVPPPPSDLPPMPALRHIPMPTRPANPAPPARHADASPERFAPVPPRRGSLTVAPAMAAPAMAPTMKRDAAQDASSAAIAAPEKPGCDTPVARYPASARVMHEQGLARVRLTIRPGGRVADARIGDSSGYDDLDDAALAAARGLICRNPGHADADVTLPVRFTLH